MLISLTHACHPAELGVRPHLSANLSRWNLLLGIPAARTASLKDLDAWTRLLRDVIGLKRLLVVVDDAWTIEEALGRVIGGPNCVYVLTTSHPQTGRQAAQVLLKQRYRMSGPVGYGGMGAVYKAEDTQLGNRLQQKTDRCSCSKRSRDQAPPVKGVLL